MVGTTEADAVRELRRAFDEARLSLFLGAGCSVASGVPTWERLVTQLYVNGIVRKLGRHLSVPGLVSAVGHWAFAREIVPLEVAARGLRRYYESDAMFMLIVRTMLYGLTGLQQWSRPRSVDVRKLLRRNHTLRAVAGLCRLSIPSKRGVQAVITYNYDDLLEWMLERRRFQSVWNASMLRPRHLPIYHVHGLVPLREGRGSLVDEIVLSEDQYNRAAQDAYTWQNLVQMQALSETVSVMVGLSLTDRNLRRVLDNLRSMPRRNRSYALLKRPSAWNVGDQEVAAILKEMKERVRTGFEFGYDERAVALLDRPSVSNRIVSMIRDLQRLDLRRQEETLAELGVTVIWYDSHEDVAKVLGSIVRRRKH
jgi:hypothetical protein